MGWAKNDNEVRFHPSQLIGGSVVAICVLSSEGEMMWDLKIGDYNQKQLTTTLCKFADTFYRSGPLLLLVNSLKHREFS